MSRREPSQVSVKTAATVAGTALGVGVAAWFLWRTATAVLLTAISLLVAVALNHIVVWLDGRGLRRGWSIAMAMLGLVGAIVGLFWLVIPPLVTQVDELIASWPRIVSTWEGSSVFAWLERHVEVQTVLDHVRGQVPSLVGGAIGVVEGVVVALGGLVTVLFLVTFMLTAGRQLVWRWLAEVRPEARDDWASLTVEVYHAIGGYVLGHLAIIATQMVATSTWLFVWGIPYFLPLGIVSGTASLIPFAGAMTMGTIVSLIAWATQGLWTGIATALYYVAYQQFENHVLTPMVYRRTVQLNPLVILLVVLFLFEFAGIPGAILAVPIAASGQIIVRTLLERRRERLRIPPTPPRPELLHPAGGDAPADEPPPS